MQFHTDKLRTVCENQPKRFSDDQLSALVKVIDRGTVWHRPSMIDIKDFGGNVSV